MPTQMQTPALTPALGRHPALALVAAITLALDPSGMAGAAFAADGGSTAGSSASATPRPRKSAPRTAKAAPSDESRAERDRRLQRECRGRPNAGACLGHAS